MYRLFLPFLLLSLQAYASDNKIMPSELYEVANQHQCEAISSFYNDRPDVIRPPYIYGYIESKTYSIRSENAVFWCRSRKDKERYKLVVYISPYIRKVAAKYFNCPHEIETDTAGGLFLHKEETLLLKDFYYVDSGKPVPEVTVKNATLIENQGIEVSGASYFCHEGKWIVRFWH